LRFARNCGSVEGNGGYFGKGFEKKKKTRKQRRPDKQLTPAKNIASPEEKKGEYKE